MKNIDRDSPQQRVAGVLLLSMIFASVVSGFGLTDFLWVSGLCALAALVLLWPRSQRTQRVQCIVFIAIGLMCLAFAWIRGHGEIPIRQLLTQNHLLISLLCAVSFLRLITDTRAASGKTPKTGKKAFLQTISGLHFFSSVINLSALIIFGDALSRNQKLSRTTATSLQRGFSL
ncbi:MAG: hypothetical protein VYB82_04735, partial [Pseudomonadota bacterium]|nr:hypothetical protein [Pseudomonadota bacterium]